jgi:hypothetical protein
MVCWSARARVRPSKSSSSWRTRPVTRPQPPPLRLPRWPRRRWRAPRPSQKTRCRAAERRRLQRMTSRPPGAAAEPRPAPSARTRRRRRTRVLPASSAPWGTTARDASTRPSAASTPSRAPIPPQACGPRAASARRKAAPRRCRASTPCHRGGSARVRATKQPSTRAPATASSGRWKRHGRASRACSPCRRGPRAPRTSSIGWPRRPSRSRPCATHRGRLLRRTTRRGH